MKRAAFWSVCVLLVVGSITSTTGCDRTKSDAENKAKASPAEQGAAARKADEDRNIPRIADVDFTPSKFILCGKTVQICARATHPDRKKLEFSWEQIEGKPPRKGLEVMTNFESIGGARECVKVTPDRGENKYRLTVSVPGEDEAKNSIVFPIRAGRSSACS